MDEYNDVAFILDDPMSGDIYSDCYGLRGDVAMTGFKRGPLACSGWNAIDRSGLRVGRLLVLSKSPIRRGKDKVTQYLCRCDCGKEVLIADQMLVKASIPGETPSCGCYRKEWKQKFKKKTLEGYEVLKDDGVILPDEIKYLRTGKRMKE